MLQLRSTSPADTHAIAAVIAGVARSGDIIVLAGDMGAGKTAFAQGFGAAMGVTDHMTSPTYNLVHSHPAGRLVLHHADLYRLSTQHEVADLAFAELAESGGVIIVEWGDVVATSFGDHLLVSLEPVEDAEDAEDERILRVQAAGRSWAGRWAEIERGLGRFAC
jgi:tRNA threonylcarbamoyladenosine biosynthesis protein TsaE